MAGIQILYPDVLSADNHAVERSISGNDVEFAIFNEREPGKISSSVWSGCQAMVTGISMPIDAKVISLLEECRIITRLGVGYDLIDIVAAGRAGIAVCNVPDYGTNEVADHAIALLLSFTRGIPQYTETYRADPDKGYVIATPIDAASVRVSAPRDVGARVGFLATLENFDFEPANEIFFKM